MFTCEICKSRNFLVLLNCHRKQWYSFICKSRNFLVLLNEKYLKLVPYDLQKQKFSCVTQQTKNLNTIFICKSRNFLVLLNARILCDGCLSAKAEIFLCYSTQVYIPIHAMICKSRNFLVLLNTYSVIMHKYSLSNTHINHIFCEFFTTLSSNTS